MIKRNRYLFNRSRRIERYSDYIIGAPFTSCFFGRRLFINWFVIGVPAETSPTRPAVPENGSVLRILHAPSNPAFKGTSSIREVVNELRKSDDRIEYIELSNCSNKEVLDHMKQCAIVIDQLYSDTPMSGVSSEAAACGKPSIVGGYGLRELRNHVPPGSFPPTYCCHPDNLKEAVQWMIDNPRERERLGEAAQDFVSGNWSTAAVARRYMRLMQEDVPSDWFLDPVKIIYCYGAGLEKDVAKRNIHSIIAAGGVESLVFDGHPALREALTMLNQE